MHIDQKFMHSCMPRSFEMKVRTPKSLCSSALEDIFSYVRMESWNIGEKIYIQSSIQKFVIFLQEISDFILLYINDAINIYIYSCKNTFFPTLSTIKYFNTTQNKKIIVALLQNTEFKRKNSLSQFICEIPSRLPC